MRDNAFATEVRKLVKEISNDTELGAKIRILINEITKCFTKTANKAGLELFKLSSIWTLSAN